MRIIIGGSVYKLFDGRPCECIFHPTMKKLLIAPLLVLSVVAGAFAQRSVPGKPSFEAYRPLNEHRVWTFMQKDSTIGTLSSRVVGTREIDGNPGYIIQEELDLDFGKIGSAPLLRLSGEHYVGYDGSYLGDDFDLTIGELEGRVELRRDGQVIRGSMRQAGRRDDVEVSFRRDGKSVDNYMFDQYELYFASQGLTEGETVNDTVFVPRDASLAPIVGEVVGWTWQQLYRGVYDSVFVVRLQQPAPMELFINADLALRKVNIPTLDMRVYLDAARVERRPEEPGLTWGRVVDTLPMYLVYVLVGLLGVLLFAGREMRRRPVWLGLAAGAVSFVLVGLVQMPLQKSIFDQLFGADAPIGFMAFVLALAASAPAGPIQEGLKFLGAAFFSRGRDWSRMRLMAVGTAFGGGLGIVEAAYLDTVVPVTTEADGALLMRLLFVLFHATTGGLIGYGLGTGKRTTAQVIAVTMLLNVVLRGLPIVVQIGVMEYTLVALLSGLVVVLLMLWAIILQRRAMMT